MEGAGDWQNPFVDVFKRFSTFDAANSFKGAVAIVHDPAIARKCFKINGSILSNNTVTIPDPTDPKPCHLVGRYIYIEMLVAPEKYYCLHVELGIKDREPGVRFTLTNMEKDYTVVGGNTLKIPFHGSPRNLWTIVCIDIEHHLENFGLFTKGAIRNYAGVHALRGLQLCSNITIRGIYTSDNIYDWDTLPKEMAFKIVKGGRWEDLYAFAYLPSSIDPGPAKKAERLQNQQLEADFPNNIVQRDEPNTRINRLRPTEHSMNGSRLQQPASRQVEPLTTESFLQLDTALSHSSLHNPDLLYKGQNVIYSGGSIIIIKNVVTGKQTFLQGHLDYVAAMDWNGDWIVTVEKIPRSNVRVWIDFKCICSFPSPYESVQQIRLNDQKHLAMVGLDGYRRQVVLLFDISKIESEREPLWIAKQISDFSILTLKWSPNDPTRLVSCGKENIRFWRVKSQHLPGSPVILNHHARATTFTTLDFEIDHRNANPVKQLSSVTHVFVASQTGLLFKVGYESHQLIEVYRLHDGAAIVSLAVGPGFCLTGCEDKSLRMWNLNDFTDFVLEVHKDGAITGLAVNETATSVACATSAGSLSLLDLTANSYKMLSRAHTESVSQLCLHDHSNSMISLSGDLTIRMWDCDSLQQTYEFNYTAEDPCLCIAANPLGMSFAAGLRSGTLRVFDIENTSIIEEIKYHEAPIVFLEYSADGKFLAVLEGTNSMLYSPLHSYQPVKKLPQQLPSKYQHCSFTPDSETLAIIGDSGTHINLWELRSLQEVGKLFAGKCLTRLRFDRKMLWACFEDTSIRRYNIEKMTLEVEMHSLHRQFLSEVDFCREASFLFSVGGDTFVKIWDYSFQREPHQVYLGHTGVVNSVRYHNSKLWTAGTEGILVWQFNDLQPGYTPAATIKDKKVNFLKSPLYKTKSDEPEASHISEEPKGAPQPILFSAVLKRSAEPEQEVVFAPQTIESKFAPKIINYRKNKRREGKPKMGIDLPKSYLSHSLPFKHRWCSSLTDSQVEYTHKIERLKESSKRFRMEYFVGTETFAHDHIVWNFMYGWYAYTYDNLVIIESLNKNRSQKIVTLPEKLGSLALTKDYKKLLVTSVFNPKKVDKMDSEGSEQGSEASSEGPGEIEESNGANIYVLDSEFVIEKKLQFHPKGVQSIRLSENNKYLVSIGNFRECTVCVWDFATSRLKASSYTLDKLNDISVMAQAGQGRLLEFATVGRDQILFWAYTKDEKLQYFDVFIKREEDDDKTTTVELTSCAYLGYSEEVYLLAGTTEGELLVVHYGDFKTVWRKKICSAQLTCMVSAASRTVIGSADGALYIWEHTSNILENTPTPSFTKINLTNSITALHLDEAATEGIVATIEGIYYVSIPEKLTSLLAGACPNRVVAVKAFNGFALTSLQSGKVKLWNVETGEELRTYKWKYPFTEAYNDDSTGKVVCFCKNQSIKLLNTKKFTKEEVYLPEQLGKGSDRTDDYVILSVNVAFGGRPARWIFFKKGGVFSFEVTLDGRKKSIKAEKMLELPHEMTDICLLPEKNLIITTCATGDVWVYNLDRNSKGYSLLSVDHATVNDFALQHRHKTAVLAPDEAQPLVGVHVALSRILNETYLAICDSSQYVYFRNYQKRVIFQRISLGNFPRSIYLQETKRDSTVVIGMQAGSIVTVNATDPEQRAKFETVVNSAIEGIYPLKTKDWLLCAFQDSLAFLSWQ